MSKPIVINVNEWKPTEIKFMAPKVNERGGKAISLISKQSNRSLHISTPLLMTWGISDFVDEKTGESDGKFSMTLSFPNDEYANAQTREFLQKLKDFENHVLDEAVRNSEAWWGDHMSREVAKHTFFPILKYSKNKDTKKFDYSKPPSIRAKVPYYDNRWAVEIYDTKSNLIFPCENEHITPIDLVPKMSSVACVLQCGGIWIGGKGWGLTWKLIQCVVKPKEVVSVYGKCHIQLSAEEKDSIDAQQINDDADSVSEPPVSVFQPPAVVLAAPVKVEEKPITKVEDSDDEGESAQVAPVAVAPVVVEEPVKAAEPVKKVVKKVVKKTT
jgi:hypothetical protein